MLTGGSLVCINDHLIVGCLQVFESILESCHMCVCLMEHVLDLLDFNHLDVMGHWCLVSFGF